MKIHKGQVLENTVLETSVVAEAEWLAQSLYKGTSNNRTKFEDFLNLPTSKYDVLPSSSLKHVVVIGIGGSSLSPKAVYDALFGYFDQVQPERLPKLHFLENVNMSYIDALMAVCENLAFVVICKSGKTFETLKNLEYLTSEKYRGVIKGENTYVVSVEGSHTWEWGKTIGAKLFPMSQAISGRFQVFSAVTAVPLGLVGVNVEEFFDGGLMQEAFISLQADVVRRFQFYKNGIDTDVYFAFDERLRSLAEWYASITAESLGKNGGGITPIVSIGSRDLHSFGQLCLQGRRNKFTAFLSLSNTDSSNLFILEAVKKTYDDAKLPYIHIELNAESVDILTNELGEFMQSKMIETVLLGGLMGVNPYDQPGVELYKKYLE